MLTKKNREKNRKGFIIPSFATAAAAFSRSSPFKARHRHDHYRQGLLPTMAAGSLDPSVLAHACSWEPVRLLSLIFCRRGGERERERERLSLTFFHPGRARDGSALPSRLSRLLSLSVSSSSPTLYITKIGRGRGRWGRRARAEKQRRRPARPLLPAERRRRRPERRRRDRRREAVRGRGRRALAPGTARGCLPEIAGSGAGSEAPECSGGSWSGGSGGSGGRAGARAEVAEQGRRRRRQLWLGRPRPTAAAAATTAAAAAAPELPRGAPRAPDRPVDPAGARQRGAGAVPLLGWSWWRRRRRRQRVMRKGEEEEEERERRDFFVIKYIYTQQFMI